jgi:heptosyltransferase-2
VADNILLVPKGFFGDILLITPALDALKQSDPANVVTLVCAPPVEAFARGIPGVDQVLVFDRNGRHAGWRGVARFAEELRACRFTRAYSFHRSPRTSFLLYRAQIPNRTAFADSQLGFLYTERVPKCGHLHDVVRNLQLVRSALSKAVQDTIGQLADTESGSLGLNQEVSSFGRLRVPLIDREKLSESVKRLVSSGEPYLVLAPGSAWATKRWYADGYREVAQTVHKRGLRVVVVGSAQEQALCRSVAAGLSVDNLCGETSVSDLVALIGGASALVCNDSLALHIASATQTPTVAVFCATTPRFGFGPWQNRAVTVEKEGLYCKPCHRHGSHSCPNGTKACMTEVKGGDVVSALDRLGITGRISKIDRCSNAL